MIPANFNYIRPAYLDEALTALAENEEAKILAGGHSLIPAMKLRLATPRTIVDISRIADLGYIRHDGEQIVVGAMATHAAIESSALLAGQCPLLPEVAATIGDAQVRNRGTIGGSLVHADPAADWPAAILALEAQLEIAGPGGRRLVNAADFFIEMMQSAVQPNEILVEVRLPVTMRSVAYVKFAQKASGFAIAGVAAVIDAPDKAVQIGVTGAATKAFRATAAEEFLRGQTLTPANIALAADKADEGIETLNDIHASAEFRAHLTRLHTRRALELAASRG